MLMKQEHNSPLKHASQRPGAVLKTSPTGKTDTRLALRVGVFYTNHCIVRNHSCPPHERAQAACLGLLTARCLQPAAPCSTGQLLALGWLPGAQQPWGHSSLPCLPWACQTHSGACTHTGSPPALLHSIQVSLQSKPAAGHLHKPLAGPAFGVLGVILPPTPGCPVVLSQHMQNSLGLPGEKTHNEPLLKLV